MESFDTSPRGSERGTVLANSDTPAGTHGGDTCETTCHQIACVCTHLEGTCDYSCGLDGCDHTAHPAACPSQPGYQGC